MFVVVVGDLFSVIHAAEADFDCVTIKDFSYFVVFWEVLVSYSKESVSDICAYIFVEWGVVPTYVVLLTVFLFFSCGCFIMKSGLVSAFVECFLIWSRPSISEST